MSPVTLICLLIVRCSLDVLANDSSKPTAKDGPLVYMSCPNWQLVQLCLATTSGGVGHLQAHLCTSVLRSCLQHLWSIAELSQQQTDRADLQDTFSTEPDVEKVSGSEKPDSDRKLDARHLDIGSQKRTDQAQYSRYGNVWLLEHNDHSPAGRISSETQHGLTSPKSTRISQPGPQTTRDLQTKSESEIADRLRNHGLTNEPVPTPPGRTPDELKVALPRRNRNGGWTHARTVVKKWPGPPEVVVTNTSITTDTGVCNHVIDTKLIAIPGCVPKSVLFTHCLGRCPSHSVPAWNRDAQELRQIEHCTCCIPHRFRYRTIRFACPGRDQKVLISNMAFPFTCACRPCADVPEVTARQPYDY